MLADSHGDPQQAHRILPGALRRSPDGSVPERAAALAFLAELAVRTQDPAVARGRLDDLDALAAGLDERTARDAAVVLAQGAGLRADLGPPAGPLDRSGSEKRPGAGRS